MSHLAGQLGVYSLPVNKQDSSGGLVSVNRTVQGLLIPVTNNRTYQSTNRTVQGCITVSWWWCRVSCLRMSVDILGTNCLSMVQCCFTSTETVRLVRTESPGRPPRLSHSSWTLITVSKTVQGCIPVKRKLKGGEGGGTTKNTCSKTQTTPYVRRAAQPQLEWLNKLLLLHGS